MKYSGLSFGIRSLLTTTVLVAMLLRIVQLQHVVEKSVPVTSASYLNTGEALLQATNSGHNNKWTWRIYATPGSTLSIGFTESFEDAKLLSKRGPTSLLIPINGHIDVELTVTEEAGKRVVRVKTPTGTPVRRCKSLADEPYFELAYFVGGLKEPKKLSPASKKRKIRLWQEFAISSEGNATKTIMVWVGVHEPFPAGTTHLRVQGGELVPYPRQQ